MPSGAPRSSNPGFPATKFGPCFQPLTAQGDFTIEPRRALTTNLAARLKRRPVMLSSWTRGQRRRPTLRIESYGTSCADTKRLAGSVQRVQWFIDAFRCHLKRPEVHPYGCRRLKIEVRLDRLVPDGGSAEVVRDAARVRTPPMRRRPGPERRADGDSLPSSANLSAPDARVHCRQSTDRRIGRTRAVFLAAFLSKLLSLFSATIDSFFVGQCRCSPSGTVRRTSRSILPSPGPSSVLLLSLLGQDPLSILSNCHWLSCTSTGASAMDCWHLDRNFMTVYDLRRKCCKSNYKVVGVRYENNEAAAVSWTSLRTRNHRHWYLRFSLSLRDVEELMAERGLM